jgi:hypothetical protein
MKAKPPTKQLRRAAADLRRAHEPRYLSSDRELQRISPAAEQKTTDDVRRSELATNRQPDLKSPRKRLTSPTVCRISVT